MKKLTYNSTWKIVAAMLMTVTLGVSIFLGGLIATLAGDGLYSSGKESFEHNAMQSVVSDLIEKEWDRNYYYELASSSFDWYENSLSSSYLDGIGVEIKNEKGKTVYSTYDENTKYIGELSLKVSSCDYDDFYITAHIEKNPPKGCSIARVGKLTKIAYKHRILLAFFEVLNVMLTIALFVFLMIAAGRREGEEEIQKRKIDSGLADVYFAVLVCIAIAMISLVKSAAYASVTLAIIMMIAFLAIGSLLAVAWCMSVAVQLKTGTLIKNSLTGRCCKLLWKLIKICWEILVRMVKAVPYTWKTLLVTIILIILNISAVENYNMGFIIVESIVVLLIIAYSTMNIAILDDAAQRLANGEVGKKIQLDKMFGALKRRGENLNSIDDAVSKAVEKEMKAERFRTELITNVSHDIKTPLTSIINYTELLTQHLSESDDETAKEYLDIIHNNSLRLKKLTSDIVEASKASTGAIEVNLEKIDFGMLAEQSIYEYEEKMSSACLTPVISVEHDLMIEADGKLMWRIMDNLLSNICKYAMPGTRVYIDIRKNDNEAVAEFKNISDAELNISKDELLERFVRGDESRNTEGSGLGLSIADNLAILQNGKLSLDVDGDLFKTKLVFKLCDEQEEDK